MTALEALTREPLHGHAHLAAAAGVPAIQLGVLDTQGEQVACPRPHAHVPQLSLRFLSL